MSEKRSNPITSQSNESEVGTFLFTLVDIVKYFAFILFENACKIMHFLNYLISCHNVKLFFSFTSLSSDSSHGMQSLPEKKSDSSSIVDPVSPSRKKYVIVFMFSNHFFSYPQASYLKVFQYLSSKLSSFL